MADFGRGNLSTAAQYTLGATADGLHTAPEVINYLQGVDLGPVTLPMIFTKGFNVDGNATVTGNGGGGPRMMSPQVKKNVTEGNPGQPCLEISGPGMWRFRWLVATGSRTISVKVKQVVNAAPYPTVVVKANPGIGVNADVTGTSAGGAGWVTIGPISVTPTSDGAVWVELWNNYNLASNCPAFFDHIEVT